MDLRLEVVVIPVSDVDRAKAFYEKALGWRVDIDYSAEGYETAVGYRLRGAESYRIVQLTPPGSPSSILLGSGITRMSPGALQGMQLVTSDLEATRAELVGRGVDVGEFFHFGPNGQTPGLDPDRTSYNSYMPLRDPDGNGWLLQEIKKRLPGR
jgi:catechol 2,3-dioxygenase-like lactoylglutathione lyase family enzyme